MRVWKCQRFSHCLVIALAFAIVCNVYLVVLLWSDGRQDVPARVDRSNDVPINAIHNGHTKKAREYLNVRELERRFVSSRPTGGRVSEAGRMLAAKLLKTCEKLLQPKGRDYKKVLERVNQWVTVDRLLPVSATDLGDLVSFLQSSKIVKASVPRVGTQLKVMLTLEGGQKALFKPQWYNRTTVIEGDVYSGADRHNGEVASFYLSLLLGLRRTPVAVGRKVDLRSEIWFRADRDMAATFRRSGENGTCFYGVCRYCTYEMSVCDKNLPLEGAVVLWLPPAAKLKSYRSPWQRTYRENVAAAWQTEDDYCIKLQNTSRAFHVDSRRLLDLIDASVFDFLISNGDRHHYEMINSTSESAVLLLDNGKSFGRADVDFLDILAPLSQCCRIRKSLFKQLQIVQHGPLSALLRQVTLKDALYPLLTNHHLAAIDRRLTKVLQTIEACVQLRGSRYVLVSEPGSDSSATL